VELRAFSRGVRAMQGKPDSFQQAIYECLYTLYEALTQAFTLPGSRAAATGLRTALHQEGKAPYGPHQDAYPW
jgi:hypothetical protein